MAEWYVLQTKAQQEDIARQNLSRQSFETFLPMVNVRRHRRGHWSVASESLFPGYLFIRLDIEQQNTAPIRSTRGVVGLVKFGSRLQPIPSHFLQSLMDAQSSSKGDAIDTATIFSPGDAVELIDGPMGGLKGIFKARNSQERVIVLFNILGAEAEVNVSPNRLAISM